MPGVDELIAVGMTIAILLASGLWTQIRYHEYEKLPAHYDFRGRPTRFSSRAVMSWILPVSFSVMLLGIAFSTSWVSEDARNGDPRTGTFLACGILLGSQALVLWLLSRWARKQG